MGLKVKKGKTINILYSFEDEDGEPLNVSAWTHTFNINNTYLDDTPMVALSGGSGIDVSDAANGNITVNCTPTETTQDPAKYYYEYQVVDGDSQEWVPWSGIFEITGDVIVV